MQDLPIPYAVHVSLFHAFIRSLALSSANRPVWLTGLRPMGVVDGTFWAPTTASSLYELMRTSKPSRASPYSPRIDYRHGDCYFLWHPTEFLFVYSCDECLFRYNNCMAFRTFGITIVRIIRVVLTWGAFHYCLYQVIWRIFKLMQWSTLKRILVTGGTFGVVRFDIP